MKRTCTASPGGFTLVELLVTMTILALLVLLFAQVCNGARWVQCDGNRRLTTDEEARSVFDRMAMDFAQMLRRPDVDYWLKDDVNWQSDGNGNDKLAFFSSVPGYYPEDAWNSPISVIGYWVDPADGLQRYSRGLLWNGMDRSDPQMIFAGVSRSSIASGTNTVLQNWPGAITPTGDSNPEPAGPGVFRMEYYYVLRADGDAPPVLSLVPWLPGGSVNGMRDVAALGVVIALIDAKSRALVSGSALAKLSASMDDFSESTLHPGDLEERWQDAVKSSGLPSTVLSSIRIYRRWFYLSPLHTP